MLLNSFTCLLLATISVVEAYDDYAGYAYPAFRRDIVSDTLHSRGDYQIRLNRRLLALQGMKAPLLQARDMLQLDSPRAFLEKRGGDKRKSDAMGSGQSTPQQYTPFQQAFAPRPIAPLRKSTRLRGASPQPPSTPGRESSSPEPPSSPERHSTSPQPSSPRLPSTPQRQNSLNSQSSSSSNIDLDRFTIHDDPDRKTHGSLSPNDKANNPLGLLKATAHKAGPGGVNPNDHSQYVISHDGHASAAREDAYLTKGVENSIGGPMIATGKETKVVKAKTRELLPQQPAATESKEASEGWRKEKGKAIIMPKKKGEVFANMEAPPADLKTNAGGSSGPTWQVGSNAAGKKTGALQQHGLSKIGKKIVGDTKIKTLAITSQNLDISRPAAEITARVQKAAAEGDTRPQTVGEKVNSDSDSWGEEREKKKQQQKKQQQQPAAGTPDDDSRPNKRQRTSRESSEDSLLARALNRRYLADRLERRFTEQLYARDIFDGMAEFLEAY